MDLIKEILRRKHFINASGKIPKTNLIHKVESFSRDLCKIPAADTNCHRQRLIYLGYGNI